MPTIEVKNKIVVTLTMSDCKYYKHKMMMSYMDNLTLSELSRILRPMNTAGSTILVFSVASSTIILR